MTPAKTPRRPVATRTDNEFRRIVERAVNERIALHGRKQRHRDWVGSVVGVSLIVAGIAVFIMTNHAKGAEWVALALIVLGAGLFDRKTVTGLVKARFGSGDTGEFRGDM